MDLEQGAYAVVAVQFKGTRITKMGDGGCGTPHAPLTEPPVWRMLRTLSKLLRKFALELWWYQPSEVKGLLKALPKSDLDLKCQLQGPPRSVDLGPRINRPRIGFLNESTSQSPVLARACYKTPTSAKLTKYP